MPKFSSVDDAAPEAKLEVKPGDLLYSFQAIPYPGTILLGFDEDGKSGTKREPTVNFRRLEQLLQFLEYVVLSERLIVPTATFGKQTSKLLVGKNTWIHFALFEASGDLQLSIDDLCKPLEQAGVLYHARLGVGPATADDAVARVLPESGLLRDFAGDCSQRYPHFSAKRAAAMAGAHLATEYGEALHIAEAATLAGVPFVLANRQATAMERFEGESLRMRNAVTQRLLERLNAGARKELAKLTDFGVVSVFPETPVASLILRRANNPIGLVTAALELRQEFADFRRHMGEIEWDLAHEAIPTRIRLKRLREVQRLADSLWGDQTTDMRAAAVSISDAFAAIPEAIASPGPATAHSVATKLLSLPVDKILEFYRRRKIRVLLKAKKQFLASGDATAHVARILQVDKNIVVRSRRERAAASDPLHGGFVGP